MFETLKVLPAHVAGFEGETIGVLAFGVAGVFLLLLPFIDRRAAAARRSPLITWIGIGLITYLAVFTAMSYMSGRA